MAVPLLLGLYDDVDTENGEQREHLSKRLTLLLALQHQYVTFSTKNITFKFILLVQCLEIW